MTIKDILVYIDDTARSDVRLAVAANLAARHDAHLIGLRVRSFPPVDVFTPYPGGLMELGAPIVERMRAENRELTAALEARFEDRLRRDGIRGEWRSVEGDASDMITLHARYCDLVVVGQRDPAFEGGYGVAEISVASLMAAGRPLLVVPYAGSFEKLGDHVLVAWNGSAESARAVNDAIPLLRVAKKVTVLAINPRRGIDGDGDLPAVDIALHLARHDINAEAAHIITGEVNEGDALLSYAADIGADLIVCGLYGHTRFHEVVFGGVTRTLLTEMTVPVFTAH